MRNLFRSGAVFFIIAGFSFLAAAFTAVTYLLTGNGSAAFLGALVVSLLGMLVIGIAIRSKNTK